MKKLKLFLILSIFSLILPAFASAQIPCPPLLPLPGCGGPVGGGLPVPGGLPAPGGLPGPGGMMGGSGWNVGNYYGTGLPSASITTIVRNLLLWLLMIFGFLGIIGFVISGIMYVTAAGDEGKMETGKKAMLYSITGIAVGLAGIIVIEAVTLALNGISGF